jgi:hypothetical protein
MSSLSIYQEEKDDDGLDFEEKITYVIVKMFVQYIYQIFWSSLDFKEIPYICHNPPPLFYQ